MEFGQLGDRGEAVLFHVEEVLRNGYGHVQILVLSMVVRIVSDLLQTVPPVTLKSASVST